ncbi:MAG: toxin-antitoxin system YwqK family antitoxin, partial [Alphaproteobacteria bacterium]
EHKNGLCFYFTADGKLYKIANFLNNKLHGKYTEYYPNGKIKKTINYENNKKNGICKEYYECGALKSKTCYQDDAIHGIFEKYYTNGKLEFKAQFYENIVQGQTKKYWPNGNIRSIINYNDKGQRRGVYTEYDKNGLIIKIIMLKIIEEYHQDGTTLKAIYEVDNQEHKNGLCFYFTADGKLYKIANFLNNKLHGKYTEYYPNGKIKKEINYENNKKNGKYTEYYPNGKIKKETNFTNDIMFNKLLSFYKNGQIERKINSISGTNYYECIHFDKNGDFKEKTYGIIEGSEINYADLREIKNQRAEKAFLEQIKSREIKNNILKEQINSKEK